LGHAIVSGRFLEPRQCSSVMLQIRVEKVESVAGNPRVAGNPVLATIVGDLLLGKIPPRIFVPLLHRAVLDVHQAQHAHQDEIAMSPRVENARALVLFAVQIALPVFERHASLGKK
jgi:hypothetical protein